MEKMLEIDADKRINAVQTLSHPYLDEVRFRVANKINIEFWIILWEGKKNLGAPSKKKRVNLGTLSLFQSTPPPYHKKVHFN